jgi:hypothetical protein
MSLKHLLLLVAVAFMAFVAAWVTWSGGVFAPTVSEPTPRVAFSVTGNLVHSNPGQNGNAWFLVYEVPGAAGLVTRLDFIDTSRCTVSGKRTVACAPETLKEGARVSVAGTQMADRVRVAALTIFSN